MANAGDGGTTAAWILAVLRNLGAAPNGYNDLALALWAASEGMPDSANNWLATERGGYGGAAFNSAGVWSYPTFAIGVQATADTIRQTNMAGIYTALREARSLSFIFDAINAAPWCPGCQNGTYPVALYDYIRGLAPGAIVTPAGIGAPVQEPTQPPAWDWSAHVRDTGTTLKDSARRLSGYAAAIRHLP